MTNTGHISVPRGTDSEIFGDGSNVAMGSNSIALVTSSSTAASNLNQVVAIGANLSIVGNATRTVVIGENANIVNGSNNGVIIGSNATASSSNSDNCVAIGRSADVAGTRAIAIGDAATAAANSVAIGRSATAASNEIVIIASRETGIYVDPEGSLTIRATGIFQSGVQFPDGVTQTIAYTGQETSPGGSDSYVQYNDGGSFGGVANFTWNDTSNVLTVSGDVDITGALTATTKSFLIDHPTKEGMKLQYASLEGPENGVYVRGTTDQSTIQLPDYWVGLVDENSITVTLTPVGSFQQLYVEEKSNTHITVGGVWGSYDYVVYGERKDVDKLEVEW